MDPSSLQPQQELPEGTFHIQKESQCSYFFSASFILEPRSPIFELVITDYSRRSVAITRTSQVPSKQNCGLASSAVLSVLLGEKTSTSHHWEMRAQRGILQAFHSQMYFWHYTLCLWTKHHHNNHKPKLYQ